MVILYYVFTFMGWSFLAIAFVWSAIELYKLEKNNYV